MKKIVFAVVLLGILTYSLFSAPASLELINFVQSDGTELDIFQRGDEFVHWAETSDGYSLLNDGNNIYYYAILDSKGDMGRSEIQAHNPSNRDSNELNFLRTIDKKYHFSRNQILTFKKAFSNHFQNRMGGFPTTGTNNMLMILANFWYN